MTVSRSITVVWTIVGALIGGGIAVGLVLVIGSLWPYDPTLDPENLGNFDATLSWLPIVAIGGAIGGGVLARRFNRRGDRDDQNNVAKQP